MPFGKSLCYCALGWLGMVVLKGLRHSALRIAISADSAGSASPVPIHLSSQDGLRTSRHDPSNGVHPNSDPHTSQSQPRGQLRPLPDDSANLGPIRPSSQGELHTSRHDPSSDARPSSDRRTSQSQGRDQQQPLVHGFQARPQHLYQRRRPVLRTEDFPPRRRVLQRFQLRQNNVDIA
jgi:hypothetical protein